MALKVHNGTDFVNAVPSVYNGSSWVTPTALKVHNGTDWVTVFQNLVITPDPGVYSNTQIGSASFSVSSTITGTWRYTKSGSTAYLTATANNSNTTGFSCSVSHPGASPPSPVSASISGLYIKIDGTDYGPWTINLTAQKDPGTPPE